MSMILFCEYFRVFDIQPRHGLLIYFTNQVD